MKELSLFMKKKLKKISQEVKTFLSQHMEILLGHYVNFYLKFQTKKFMN